MSTPIDPATNLALAQQLLVVMSNITAQMDKQGKLLQTQNQLFEALCKSQECADGSKVRDLTAAAKEAQEELDRTTTTSTRLGEALEKVKNWAGSLSVPAEFLNGFKAGLNLSTNVFKNIMELGGSALGIMRDIGMTILSLPGKLFDLFNVPASGGADPYRQQLEKLRAEFGDLSIGTSKAITNMMPHMKDFEKSGLRLSKVFGRGREGLAKQLEELQKITSELGGVGRMFAEAAKGVSGLAMVLSKSGLGTDAFKSLTAASLNGGETVEKALDGMVKDVARAQKTFGISARELQKDVTEISKNFATFGPVARGVMLATSAYVKKLGITIETLKKIADKSFNFEDAAEQAAKLGETFNMALDPMKMMKANPAEKLDMIREAFFKTGQNIDQMTVQQRNYLAATSGVSEEEARLVFAQKNRSLSNAQLQDQMKKGLKTPITQAEAMTTLAKSIERLVLSGSGPKFTGFLDAFFKGFERGIRRTKEFRAVVRALRGALKAVWRGGRQVGRMFVDQFPGIKTMLVALTDMFKPARFRELMSKVVGEFRRLFQALNTDPKAGIKVFMANMKKIFFDFFNKGAPAGGRFLDGLKMFFKTVGVIFIQGLQYAFESLRDVLKFVIETIKDPSKLKAGAMEVGSGLAGMFQEAFQYLVTELGPVIKEIGPQIVELLTLVFEKYIKPHLMHLLGALLGPALFFGVARAVGAALIQTVFMGTFARMMRVVPTPPTGITPAVGGAPTNPAAMAGSLGSFGATLVKIALVMAVIAVTVRLLMPLILSIAEAIDNSGVSKESLIFTVILMGMFGILFLGIGLLLKSLQPLIEAGSAGAGTALAYMGIIALAIAAIAVTAAVAVRMFAGVTPEQALTTAIAIGTMGILFGGIGLLLIKLGALAAPGSAAAPPAIAYMAIIAGAMVVIAFAAYIAVKAFGSMKMEEVAVTLAAIGGMAIIFVIIGSLIVLLGAQGTAAAPLLPVATSYLVAVVIMMAVIGVAAYAAVKAFGSMKMEEVAVTLAAIGGMALVFGAVGTMILLLGVAAVIGMPLLPIAALYLVGIGVFIYKLVDFGKNLVRSVASMKEEDIKKAVTLLDGMGDIVSNVASALAKVSLVAALSPIGALVGLGMLGKTMKQVIEWTKEMVTQMSGVNITEEKAKAFGAILGAMGTLIENVAEAISEIAGGGSTSLMSMIYGVDFSFGNAEDTIMRILPIIDNLVKGILTSVSGIQGDPASLKAKADVFTAIATGIGAVLKPISDTIKALSDSETAGWFDNSVDLSSVTTQIQIFLSQLLNPTTGLIPLLLNSFQNLSYSQAEGLKTGGEVLKNIISPIADLAKVLPEMIKAVTGLVDELDDEGKIGEVLTNISTMVTTIVNGIQGAVSTMLISIGKLLENPAITPAKLEAAKSFGDIFKGIGELIKAIMPSGETLAQFKNGMFDTPPDMGLVDKYMKAMVCNITTLMGNETSGIIQLVKKIAEITLTPSQIEGLKVIGPLIAAIGALVTSLMPNQAILDKITQELNFGSSAQTRSSNDGNARRIRDFIQTISRQVGIILPIVSEFIRVLATAMSGITPSQVEGLKAVGPIIAAIGGLIKEIMPSTDILNRIAPLVGDSAAAATDNATKINAYLTQMNTTLTTLLNGDPNIPGSGVKNFVNSLLTSLSSANLTESGAKGLATIGTIISSITGIIGPIMSAMKGFTDNVRGTDPGVIYQIGTQMQGIIWSLTGAITNIFTAIPTLVGLLVHMDLGRSGARGLNAKVAAIKGIFEFVGTVSTAVSNIRGAGGTGGAPITDIYHQLFEPVMQLLSYIFGGDQSVANVAGSVSLQGIINKISALRNMDGLKARAVTLKSLFETIATIATAVKGLKDNFTGSGHTAITAEQLNPGFESIRVGLSAFQTGGSAAFLGTLNMTNLNRAHSNLVGSAGSHGHGATASMGTKITEIAGVNGLGGLQTALRSLAGVTTGIASIAVPDFAAVETKTNDLLTRMGTLATNLGSGSGAGQIERILNAFTGHGFVAKVRSAVTAYNSFSDELARVGGGDVNVALRALGNNLVGRADETLGNTAARINVHVNVSLDADNMSRVLYHYSGRDSSNTSGTAHGPAGSIMGSSFNPLH